MKVENALHPNKDQIAGFRETHTGEIYMVNLLKFRETAKYADGRETTLSGEDAYMLYAREVRKLLEGLGGELIFSAQVTRLMLGEVEDLWDQVAIARYPSRAAMKDMMLMPEYADIHIHREAGLLGQLNIETALVPEQV